MQRQAEDVVGTGWLDIFLLDCRMCLYSKCFTFWGVFLYEFTIYDKSTNIVQTFNRAVCHWFCRFRSLDTLDDFSLYSRLQHELSHRSNASIKLHAITSFALQAGTS